MTSQEVKLDGFEDSAKGCALQLEKIHFVQNWSLTPVKYIRPMESSEGGPQSGIPLGNHCTGQAPELGKRGRF